MRCGCTDVEVMACAGAGGLLDGSGGVAAPAAVLALLHRSARKAVKQRQRRSGWETVAVRPQELSENKPLRGQAISELFTCYVPICRWTLLRMTIVKSLSSCVLELTSPRMLVLQEMKLRYDPDLERGISHLRMCAVISLA